MTNKNLIENEHALSTPTLIGTDQEKILGIKFWSDVIGLIRTINTTFISYENKKAVIDAFRHELGIIEIEIDNVSSVVSQSSSMEIPSADQTLPGPVDAVDVNVVDLTKSGEVSPTVLPSMGRPVPTFENLDKLRRVAGSGIWDKNYNGVKKK